MSKELSDGGPSIVVVEPDATSLDCDRAATNILLREAVRTFKAVPGVWVYLDGGHPGWHSVDDQAERLKAAGYDAADGFSLNVSAFSEPAEAERYGDDIVDRIGGGYVLDVSRAGARVRRGEWCNPPAARVGPAPSLEPANPRVDAWLWIKRPGESDGECNGGPPAGQWWQEGAARLFSDRN